MEDDLLECAFKQYAKRSNCVAYCKYHNCYLTIIHLKNMKCLHKNCKHLEKETTHKFWLIRKKKKEDKKRKKKKMSKEEIETVINILKREIDKNEKDINNAIGLERNFIDRIKYENSCCVKAMKLLEVIGDIKNE